MNRGGQDRGENADLRMLFFRLASLSELPMLPLFIFDGRERPKVKRGSKMGKAGSHGLTDSFKKVLDGFGMEWRMVSPPYYLTSSELTGGCIGTGGGGSRTSSFEQNRGPRCHNDRRCGYTAIRSSDYYKEVRCMLNLSTVSIHESFIAQACD